MRCNGFFNGGASPNLSEYAKLSAANYWTGLNQFSNGLTANYVQTSLVKLITDTTKLNGATSGDATYTMPFQGSAYKKVVVYCNALLGVTTLYTFPTAFTDTPAIVSTNQLSSSLVTTLTKTAMAVTGATSTGFIILEGY